jgi:diguanylate cyclase (GGDEF)-like protein
LTGCAFAQEVTSLAGSWSFHPGDNPAWAAADFDDSSWTRIKVPLSWGVQGFQDVSGIAWYRIRVNRAAWPSDQPLGVTIGKVNSAYELYADGEKVGEVGEFPPHAREDFDRHGTFLLPAARKGGPALLTLALRVWRPPNRPPGEAGTNSGPFELGPLSTLIERKHLSEVDRLVLSCIFVMAAIYTFGLWLLRPRSTEYAWFAAVALAAGVYGFLLTQWKYTFFSDFILMKKTENVILHLTPIPLFQFVWTFLGRRVPTWMRVLQVVFGVVGLWVIVSPGLETQIFLLPYLEIVCGVTGLVVLGLLGYWIYQGDRNAIAVGIGILALAIAMTRDSLLDRGEMVGPTWAPYGFGVMVVGLALALAIRFRGAMERLDQMSRELEGRVRQRTAELADAYRQMKDLALRDPLTNLLNRRSVNERAAAGLSLAHRRGFPYALALIDVDHFKSINDAFGHGAGDRVLVAVAEALSSTVRASDEVSRWGGEEFLVLLPDCDCVAAQIACERLRAAIEAAVVVGDDGTTPIRVTASIGVAFANPWGRGPAQFEDLVRQADRALYAAKEAGRNRIHCTALVPLEPLKAVLGVTELLELDSETIHERKV